MGTNYYMHEQPACPTCGAPKGERKHIGKSSAGWCFSLHVIPEEGIHDLPDWERRWSQPGAWIEDEYGQTVTIEEMHDCITKRGRPPKWDENPSGYNSWADFHRRNYSAQGPNGLLRHKLGEHCLKHGAGTWDCIPGEFS